MIIKHYNRIIISEPGTAELFCSSKNSVSSCEEAKTLWTQLVSDRCCGTGGSGRGGTDVGLQTKWEIIHFADTWLYCKEQLRNHQQPCWWHVSRSHEQWWWVSMQHGGGTAHGLVQGGNLSHNVDKLKETIVDLEKALIVPYPSCNEGSAMELVRSTRPNLES